MSKQRRLYVKGEMRVMMEQLGYCYPSTFMSMVYEKHGRILTETEQEVLCAIEDGKDVVIVHDKETDVSMFLACIHYAQVAKYLMYENARVQYYTPSKERVKEHGEIVRWLHKETDLPYMTKLIHLLNFKYQMLSGVYLIGRHLDKLNFGSVIFESLSDHPQRDNIMERVLRNIPVDINLTITLEKDHVYSEAILDSLEEARVGVGKPSIHLL